MGIFKGGVATVSQNAGIIKMKKLANLVNANLLVIFIKLKLEYI